MGTYRQSRNIEASIIDKLTADFLADWSGISVEKTFARIYDISLPSICIRVETTDFDKVEIGGDNVTREAQVLIDVFGTSDGNAHDLIDYIVTKLKGGCVYYEYEITSGTVDSKTANGRIRIKNIDITPINFDEDKSKLDAHDRFRKLITLTISTGEVE